jgi:hypothetical protein
MIDIQAVSAMPDPIKQISLSPALTALAKDIFGPSAKLLGTELKSYLKEKFDAKREERRRHNVARHLEEVEKVVKPSVRPREEVTYSQEHLFLEWVEGAQDVSDDEPELARLWRSLLGDIATSGDIHTEQIALLKQMDSAMAKQLVQFDRDRKMFFGKMEPIRFYNFRIYAFGLGSVYVSGERLYQTQRLEKLLLVERDYVNPILARALLLFVVTVATLFWSTDIIIRRFTLAGLIYLLALWYLPMRSFFGYYRLSWKGASLMKRLLEFDKRTGTSSVE